MLGAQWSKSDFETQFPNCHSLKDLITEIEGVYWSKGEVVCGIKVNGMTFTENDEKEYSTSDISEIDTIEVQVENTEVLMVKTSEEMRQWLSKAQIQSVEIAEKFQSNKLEEAHGEFIKLVSGCQWLTETWGLLKALSASPANSVGLEKRLVQVVGELLEAFEAGDYQLASDILEYELSECLKEWNKII